MCFLPVCDSILKQIEARILFVIVPLGKNGKYIAPANELDLTHKIRESESWWISKFIRNGWDFEASYPEVQGIKEAYRKYKRGHGFFILKKC